MENRQQNIELAKDEQIVYQKVIKDNTYLMVIAIAIMLFSIGSSFYLISKLALDLSAFNIYLIIKSL